MAKTKNMTTAEMKIEVDRLFEVGDRKAAKALSLICKKQLGEEEAARRVAALSDPERQALAQTVPVGVPPEETVT